MKRLQESTVSDNVVLHALGNIGLGNHGNLFQRFYPQKLNGNRPFAYSAPVSTQNKSGFYAKLENFTESLYFIAPILKLEPLFTGLWKGLFHDIIKYGVKSLMLHHLMPQSIESDAWGAGRGVQAFDSCMWLLRYQVYGIWGCYLDFLWVGRKQKNWEESNLHMGIGQEAPPKTISLPITIPKWNLFSTQLYLATRTLGLNSGPWQLHGK